MAASLAAKEIDQEIPLKNVNDTEFKHLKASQSILKHLKPERMMTTNDKTYDLDGCRSIGCTSSRGEEMGVVVPVPAFLGQKFCSGGFHKK